MFSELDKIEEVSRHVCATLTHKSRQNRCIPYDVSTPRTNKVRPRTRGPARHGPPHQSLPDIPGQTKSDLERAALRATVLRTSLSPTFPDKQSPTSNARPCAPRSSAPASPQHPRTNKVRPRMLGAARLARTRVPNISPLTRGNKQ